LLKLSCPRRKPAGLMPRFSKQSFLDPTTNDSLDRLHSQVEAEVDRPYRSLLKHVIADADRAMKLKDTCPRLESRPSPLRNRMRSARKLRSPGSPLRRSSRTRHLCEGPPRPGTGSVPNLTVPPMTGDVRSVSDLPVRPMTGGVCSVPSIPVRPMTGGVSNAPSRPSTGMRFAPPRPVTSSSKDLGLGTLPPSPLPSRPSSRAGLVGAGAAVVEGRRSSNSSQSGSKSVSSCN